MLLPEIHANGGIMNNSGSVPRAPKLGNDTRGTFLSSNSNSGTHGRLGLSGNARNGTSPLKTGG